MHMALWGNAMWVGMLMLHIIIRVVCAIGAGLIARYKGRSIVGWGFAGFFLAVIGIIIVAVLPNRKEEAARRRYAEQERRRLREQLRQERLKNEAFRQYTMDRLDTHDQALGMDTRTRDALPAGTEAALRQLADGGQAPGAAGAGGMLPPPSPFAPVWFYEFHGQAKGPVSAHDIRRMLGSSRITPLTLIWSQDLGEWTPLREVAAFQHSARA